MTADLPLTDLHLCDLWPRPARAWLLSEWGLCECGTEWAGPIWAYDGDHVACVGCGDVASVSADEAGACVSDAHSRLLPAALAGLRRILGLTDPTWPDPWGIR
jgi:hypothetical protein